MWNQTYEIVVTSPDGSSKTIPAFIKIEGTTMIIENPGALDVGSYEIKMCSQIDNSLRTKSCSEFKLEVKPIGGANITVSIMPDWLVNLEDQRVRVGESLVYSPGI